MEKIISTRDFSSIKKMAQIVNPLVSKKATIIKKIAALREEVEGPSGLDVQIAGMEAGIKAKYCGLGTEQLVTKKVVPAVREDGTPVLDAKTGKQLTKTTWEPTELLQYNEEKNHYVLTVPDNDQQAPMTQMGNDYDEDAQKLAEEAEAAQEEAYAEEANENNPFNM